MLLSLFLFFLAADLLLWPFLRYSQVTPPQLSLSTGSHNDAIVVLAGRGGRLKTGFSLWQQGIAPYLLIIGANPRTTAKDILTLYAHELEGHTTPQTDYLLLESQSHNTLTNIVALREIINDKNFHSLIIVTSPFHLKRVYHLCRKLLPKHIEIVFHPAPTTAPELGDNSRATPLPLAIKEFIKYINALLQLPRT